MKNSDEKDPLNEKKKIERKKETNSPETFNEEKDHGTEKQDNPDVPDTNASSRDSSVEADGTTQSEQQTGNGETDPQHPDPEPTEEPEESATIQPAAKEDLSAREPDPEPTEETGKSATTKPAAKQESGGKEPDRAPPKGVSKQLIDDSEEEQNNAMYDDGMDDDEDSEPEEESVNYGLLSKEDLVKLLSEKLDNPGKGNIRKEVEDIRKVFNDKVNAEVEEKKEHFLAEGGNLEDFKPVEEPVEKSMKELLHKYKSLKAEFTRQLEKNKQENLQKKKEVLEGFRILMEGQGTFEVTFRKFKDLQKQWFAAGVVPHQNLKDLWDSYNYFVDKFNDYVRINRELRALDLKKNLELKIQLCERTEALEKEPNVVNAFKALQKNHARWREIGPIPRENRDEIWERFKQATSVINKKHQDYHSRLKESLHENLEKKVALCEKTEEIAATIYNSHGAWADKTNQVLEIQKKWKSIGYAPKKDNNAIYSRFRTACDIFFNNKAKFYAAAYEDQKENLRLKTEIAEKAESLSTNQDWKETTNELIQLQKRWKEIGPVPRRDSDKLWRRFRAACDTFFENKSKYFEDIDSTFEENLIAKEKIIAEMDTFSVSGDRKKDLKALHGFQSRFSAIGYVPSNKKDWIKDQFREAQDRLLEKTGLDEHERSIFKFHYRIESMANAPRAEMKLNFERDKLINKLQQLRNDMSVWENNIGFFKQSDSSEETIQGFQEKIEDAHKRIEALEEKIRILDDIENEN
jgi:hypothetical protein